MTTKNKFRQYRFARIQARNITRAELEAQFETGTFSLSQFGDVIEQYLNRDAKGVAPWHASEHERVGCCEGVQLAALEFYWRHRNSFSDRVPELTVANKIATC